MENNLENTSILNIKNNNINILNLELKKYIQFKIGKENFKKEDLDTVKDIILDGKTMNGLENKIYFEELLLFPNLEQIEINNTKVNKNDIDKLKNIKRISFRNCTIENVRELTNIEALTIKSSAVEEFEDIKNLNNITELELVNIEIKDFEFLKAFNNLKILKIKNIKDFELKKINFFLPIEYLVIEVIKEISIEQLNVFRNLKCISVDREDAKNLEADLENIEEKGIKILLNEIYNY